MGILDILHQNEQLAAVRKNAAVCINSNEAPNNTQQATRSVTATTCNTFQQAQLEQHCTKPTQHCNPWSLDEKNNLQAAYAAALGLIVRQLMSRCSQIWLITTTT